MCDLTWLLKTGDMEVVASNFVTCADVNQTLKCGRKPLHCAVDCGQLDVIKYLISKGAEVNAMDKHGLTPLLAACYEDQPDCVRVLLEKGADKSLQGPDGRRACDTTNNPVIKALLRDQTLEEHCHQTPEHCHQTPKHCSD